MGTAASQVIQQYISKTVNGQVKYFVETKEPITTIPFVKNHEFNYSKLLPASLERLYMGSLHIDCDIHYYSSFEWSKYYRWIGWIGNRYFGIDWGLAWHFCLCQW